MKLLRLVLATTLVSLLSFSSVSYASTPQKAIFAGGCFWCMQADFDKVPGVISTKAGYTGGYVNNPTYKQVSYKKTGHVEAVQVTFDPSKTNYETLLNVFWKNIDPTDAGGQFCDRGSSYTAAIFTLNAEQEKLAEASKTQLIKRQRFAKVVTPIKPAKKFWEAEAYHQYYYKKNPIRYKYYRYRCGRDKRLEKLWHSKAQ